MSYVNNIYVHIFYCTRDVTRGFIGRFGYTRSRTYIYTPRVSLIFRDPLPTSMTNFWKAHPESGRPKFMGLSRGRRMRGARYVFIIILCNKVPVHDCSVASFFAPLFSFYVYDPSHESLEIRVWFVCVCVCFFLSEP